MIYNSKIKKDPKGFVVESPYTHMLFYRTKMAYKIIKYKEYVTFNGKQVLVFYKKTGKIYQDWYYYSYFERNAGTPRVICNATLRSKDILLYKKFKKIALRYLKRHFPEDIL